MPLPKVLHVETPLIKSEQLSSLLNHDVYLKMETSQNAGSFKIRGIGNICSKFVETGGAKLIGCSGGNAGIAVSYSAKMLQVPCIVFVPDTTSKRSIRIMEEYGAEVQIKGKNFNEAVLGAMEESKKPGNVFIHAYDHPHIWSGNSSILYEIQKEIASVPSLIVVPVGGGGLLCGILEAMEEIGWSNVPVLTMETQGAHCFNMSVKANKIVPLDDITSIAKTLGARIIPEHLFNILNRFKIVSEVVTDAQAVNSCLKFAEDEKKVVEPSCGAALAAVYSGVIQTLIAKKEVQLSGGPVVVMVTGGSSASLEMLQDWARELN